MVCRVKQIHKVRLTVLVLIQTAGDLLVSSSLVRDRTRSAMAPLVTLAQSADILPWKLISLMIEQAWFNRTYQ